MFNAVSSQSNLTLEVNGEETSLQPMYGELISELKIKSGDNTLNLISESANVNPISSYQGEIDDPKNAIIFFTDTNSQTNKSAFIVEADSIPKKTTGSAYIRFINAAFVPDTITFLPQYNTSDPINTFQGTTTPFGEGSEFIKLNFDTDSTLVGIDALIPIEVNSNSFTILDSNSFYLKQRQVVTFVFYGNESVKNGLQLVGFIENRK